MLKLVEMTFGSHLYGTATEYSDHDFKGVFMPTADEIASQKVPKSVSTSTKKGSDRNTPEDVDSEFYSLHYFIHLACEGETVALDMLHAPLRHCSVVTDVWRDLVLSRQLFYTKNLKAFVGYARRQAAKYGVKGSRLAEAKVVLEFLRSVDPTARLRDVWNSLPSGEFIHIRQGEKGMLYEVCGKMLDANAFCRHYVPMLEAFCDRYGERARQAEENRGIDWKAVSHAFRAAYQVKHLLTEGTYTYPLPETEYLIKVKSGALHFATEVGPKLEELMTELEQLSAESSLPEKVDRKYWDWWYTSHYKEVVRSDRGYNYKNLRVPALQQDVPAQ